MTHNYHPNIDIKINVDLCKCQSNCQCGCQCNCTTLQNPYCDKQNNRDLLLNSQQNRDLLNPPQNRDLVNPQHDKGLFDFIWGNKPNNHNHGHHNPYDHHSHCDDDKSWYEYLLDLFESIFGDDDDDDSSSDDSHHFWKHSNKKKNRDPSTFSDKKKKQFAEFMKKFDNTKAKEMHKPKSRSIEPNNSVNQCPAMKSCPILNKQNDCPYLSNKSTDNCPYLKNPKYIADKVAQCPYINKNKCPYSQKPVSDTISQCPVLSKSMSRCPYLNKPQEVDLLGLQNIGKNDCNSYCGHIHSIDASVNIN